MTNYHSDEKNRRRKHSEEMLSRLSTAMEAYPPAFQGNSLNLLFLDDAKPIRSGRQYISGLDSPKLCDDRREYLVSEENDLWPFPSYNIFRRPDPLVLSERLYETFDTAEDILPTQRDIGRILHEKAVKFNPDIVLLMVVDGLSYYDLPDRKDIRPCLVNGVSITEFGFREVIGKPTVSERLFSLGYDQQLGFTYFDVKTNKLANDLYSVFGSGTVKKILTFKECLEDTDIKNMSRGFIQITGPGLDALSHHHQDEPPVKHYIDNIFERFDSLIDYFTHRHQSVLACLTADHGILWRNSLAGKWSIVNDLQVDDARSIRHIRGSRLRNYIKVKTGFGGAFSMLRIPYITRKLHNNEWGVHGGISAWESLVPLIIRIT